MITRLEDLPAFEVQRISGTSDPELDGVFKHLRSVQVGRSWLYAGESESLVGDLSDLDSTNRSAKFIAPFWSQDSANQVGSIVPWIYGYWQPNHVTMILDPAANWQRTEFVPSPAQYFEHNSFSGWMKAGKALPEGAVALHIEKDGWDHEHCEICGSKIGVGGEACGYADQVDRWLCERCYHDYAESRSLGFLLGA